MKRRHLRRGYSLLELVICMPLTAMLLLGMASAIYVSAQSTSGAAHPPAQSLIATQTLDSLMTDVRYATAIIVGTEQELICTVPDLNGNGSAESIRFYWAGASGAPLYRQLNDSSLEIVVPAVDTFSVTYITYLDAATGKTHARAIGIAVELPTSDMPVRLATTCRLLNEPPMGD